MLSMWDEGKPLAADSGPVVRCFNPKHVGGWDVQAPAAGTVGGAGHYTMFLLRLRLGALVVTQSFSSWYKVLSSQAGFLLSFLETYKWSQTLPATHPGDYFSLCIISFG